MTTRQETARSTRLRTIANRYPAPTFFALALSISWGLWIPVLMTQSSATNLHILPGGFGPALAAIVLLWVRGSSIRAWLREGFEWRVGTRWYLVALGVPVLAGSAMGGIFVATTGDFAAAQVARIVPTYPVALLLVTFVGGGQEELGWRGVALPTLQERFDALTASVVIGVVWAVWHLPLFVFDVPGYGGRSLLLYGFLVIGFSIVFTWLYNSTDGNIFLAMVLHGGVNAASGIGGAFVTDLSVVNIPVLAAYAAPVWVVAGTLILRYGRETLSADSTLGECTNEADDSEQSPSTTQKAL
ncbi:hypothetical protein AUR64_14655 [Haloprofundus marisrubri]|uniref:CAAX prenyl protease 2/Lysostaphin resistance protein A-like domain-containing protein n=1 Tax=Haloprofundus marisrubri TaxID=1514971 RepID=A0A0W1R752_9EURY|nr:type II CAAX endopeptidase family protein [Haloprofundus marisrubri]KTG09040.1 hypothetical protein AUR64_14655 [Haloprofundus marisrubri]